MVDYGQPIGHEATGLRPALVMSVDPFHRSGLAVTLPVTSTERDVPTSIEIENDGLDQTSYIQVDQIRTVSQDRMAHRMGLADDMTMVRVEHALARLLGLPRAGRTPAASS